MIHWTLFPGLPVPKCTSSSPLSRVKVERLYHRTFLISHWRSFMGITVCLCFSNGNICHKRTWQGTQFFGLTAHCSKVSPSYEQAFVKLLDSSILPWAMTKLERLMKNKQQPHTISSEKPVKLYIITRKEYPNPTRKELHISSSFKIRAASIISAVISSPLWNPAGRMQLHNYTGIIASPDLHHLKPQLLFLFFIWENLPTVISYSSRFTKYLFSVRSERL